MQHAFATILKAPEPASVVVFIWMLALDHKLLPINCEKYASRSMRDTRQIPDKDSKNVVFAVVVVVVKVIAPCFYIYF